MTHRPFLRGAVALVGIAGLSGCISFGAKPPPSLLTLTPAVSAPAGANGSGTAQTALTVLEPAAAQALAVTRVPAMKDDSSLAYIKDAVWVEKPTRLFRSLLAETIRNRTGRLVMDGADPQFATNAELRGTLRRFGYDERTGGVIVVYDAIRQDANGIITTQRFEARQPVTTVEAAPIGDALNRAANEVAVEVADWIGRAG